MRFKGIVCVFRVLYGLLGTLCVRKALRLAVVLLYDLKGAVFVFSASVHGMI